MTLKDFKALYKKYTTAPFHFSEMNSPEYEAYREAINEDKEISDWYKSKKAKEAGINPKKYCCADMAYHLINAAKEKQMLKKDPDYIEYDAVMTYDKSHKQFGIPIHDGGASYIVIKYCPWCGSKLKK